jgi:hypothetical protein
LEDILGDTPSQGFKSQYNSIDLLNDEKLFDKMPVVIIHALQINHGYRLPQNKWEQCPSYLPYVPPPAKVRSFSFCVIGVDETGIPIVVTRVGSEGSTKKIVIAGPHGDERNAQRLIMTSQKHFIKNAPPDNTVLYFIPYISPTMAFADARGIPNQFWEGGEKGKTMSPRLILTYEGNRTRKGFSINKWKLTIPELHDAMDNIMRNNIQYNNDTPLSPKWGVDANRDYYLSLHSSRAFLDFINKINGNIPDLNMRETDKQKREEIAQQILDRNIRVLMIHGYNTPGRAFCPYWVNENTSNWTAVTTEKDRDHVKTIIGALKMQPIGKESEYLYEDAPKKYLGEWVRRLYTDCKIWVCDIELEQDKLDKNNYDEGIRGPTSNRKYNHLTIEDTSLPYFKTTEKENGFLALLGGYPW